jgi:transmembrane sensor
MNSLSAEESPSGAAIKWWIRLDAGALSPAEREEFAAWLTRDPANKAAFEDVRRLWGDLECLRPLATPLTPPRRLSRGGALGAAVGVAIASLMLFFFSDDLWIILRSQARTGAIERRLMTLADGSKIELGPKSAIATDFSDKKRNVTLYEGEAWFEIAPDAARPFSVSVAGGAVTGLGAVFDISTNHARTEVTVAKERVRVASVGPSIMVHEGEQSAFSPGSAAVASYPVEVDHVASWRRGKLIFDDKPLAEVVSILERYQRGYIVIVDPALRARRISGVFDATKPMVAIQAIERAFGLRAFQLGYFVALTG